MAGACMRVQFDCIGAQVYDKQSRTQVEAGSKSCRELVLLVWDVAGETPSLQCRSP